jgi:hypothetical protein
MTINTTLFTEWRDRKDWELPPYESASPNLLAILDYLTNRWGGVSLGIETKETLKVGARPRAHHFGAALDWRWQAHSAFGNRRFITRTVLDAEVLPFLINWSQELGIQAIHDGTPPGGRIGRVWRSVREVGMPHGWQPYSTGYTGWIHIETTPQSFSDNVPVQTRLDIAMGQPPQGPPDMPEQFGPFGLWPLNARKPRLERGKVPPAIDNGAVRYLQQVIALRAGGNIAVDGAFGPQTEKRVRDLQTFFGLVVDGIVGQQTWRTIDWLAVQP